MKAFKFPKTVHFRPVTSTTHFRRVSQKQTGWDLHDQIPLEKKRIINKNTILRDVDKVLGRKPPSIEVLYVNPPWKKAFSFWTTSLNPYGHSAIRYTLPSGEQVVMNIVGLAGAEMVNFLTPEDYLFGLPEETEKIGSEQGGVYRRSIVGARIESVSDDQVMKLHNYYKELKRRSTTLNEDALFQDAGFSLMFGPIINFFRRWKIGRLLFGQIAEKGRPDFTTIDPQEIVHTGLLEDSLNVEFYRGQLWDGGWLSGIPWSIENFIFKNLHKFADAKVSVKRALVTNGTVVYEDKQGHHIALNIQQPIKEPDNTPCFVGITKFREKGFKTWFSKTKE